MRLIVIVLGLLPALAFAGDPPTVRVNDAADTLAAALAAVDPEAKPGATILVAHIEKPAPKPNEAPVPMALRATLARHQLKILDEVELDGGIALTVQHASGARAQIAVDPHGGRIYLTPKPATTKPPGRCVAIPQASHAVFVNSSGISSDGEAFQGNQLWDFKTRRLHDVDGDGIADAFVPIAKAKNDCPEKVSFRVFVVRGSCGHELGVIGPGSFAWDAATQPLDASGFRPFTMEATSSSFGKRGLPELTTTTRQFRVHKGKYAQRDAKTQTGVCHHCATWHCNGK